MWLLCERGLGPTGRRKHYVVSLPASASLAQLVRLAHHRWAIEQHYQDLKTELGLDHFEGRTYPGWLALDRSVDTPGVVAGFART